MDPLEIYAKLILQKIELAAADDLPMPTDSGKCTLQELDERIF